MKILFAGQEFFLHPSGVLIWPGENLLIVSDLHLEKGSHFARRGFFLPPYDSRRTLEDLARVCAETGIGRLMLLGDCFHDPQGYARLNDQTRAAFAALTSLNPLWIYGNHDGEFVPPGFTPMREWESRGLVFRHEATRQGQGEISGHYHPKAEIKFHGVRLSRRCFMEDGRKLILPAFGAYTGGLAVTDKAFRALFPVPPRYYVLGDKGVYRLDDTA